MPTEKKLPKLPTEPNRECLGREFAEPRIDREKKNQPNRTEPRFTEIHRGKNAYFTEPNRDRSTEILYVKSSGEQYYTVLGLGRLVTSNYSKY